MHTTEIVLIIAMLIIPGLAHFYIKSSYNKQKKIVLDKKISGFEVARKILDANDLGTVYVVETKGELSDHYDPSKKVVRLSPDVYHGETIAAASIAAHEVGHAIQHKEGYLYMKFRSLIFPVVKISTQLSYVVIMIGFIAEMLNLIYLGIGMVAVGLLFQLVTLPVEFNASKRAKEELQKFDLITPKERVGASNMLNAAAMTYVAGVVATSLQLIRLLMIANRRR